MRFWWPAPEKLRAHPIRRILWYVWEGLGTVVFVPPGLLLIGWMWVEDRIEDVRKDEAR